MFRKKKNFKDTVADAIRTVERRRKRERRKAELSRTADSVADDFKEIRRKIRSANRKRILKKEMRSLIEDLHRKGDL